MECAKVKNDKPSGLSTEFQNQKTITLLPQAIRGLVEQTYYSVCYREAKIKVIPLHLGVKLGR
jgi:hypothetical protein